MEIYMCSLGDALGDALSPQKPCPPRPNKMSTLPTNPLHPIINHAKILIQKKQNDKKVPPCYKQETWLICQKGVSGCESIL